MSSRCAPGKDVIEANLGAAFCQVCAYTLDYHLGPFARSYTYISLLSVLFLCRSIAVKKLNRARVAKTRKLLVYDY